MRDFPWCWIETNPAPMNPSLIGIRRYILCSYFAIMKTVTEDFKGRLSCPDGAADQAILLLLDDELETIPCAGNPDALSSYLLFFLLAIGKRKGDMDSFLP